MIWLAIIGTVMMLLALLYALVLVAALTGLSLPGKTQSMTDPDHPFVSVIVPVRNEEDRIHHCLESLCSQKYHSGKFEILISDDFSEDMTLGVVDDFIQKHPHLRFSIVKGEKEKNPASGKKGAITRAVGKASGTLILATDADTLHDPGWISGMVECYRETGAKMILGPVMFADSKTIFGKLQTLEFLGIMGLTAGFAGIGRPVMCNGANLCYEKAAFYEVGGFEGNEQFASGDDQFLLWKIKQRFGGRSVHFLGDPDVIVTTTPELEIMSFLWQRLRWISKSRGYHDSLVMGVGAVNYLFQVMISAGFLLGILSPLYLYLAVSLLCFKLLVDFPIVFAMAGFFSKRHLWIWYIPAQLFQVIYVTISVPMAFLIPVRWKGRRV